MIITYPIIVDTNGNLIKMVLLDHEDGSFTSMTKDAYFAQLDSEPTQDEINAENALMAQAQQDVINAQNAQIQADAQIQTKLAEINSKLAAIGLTPDDLNTLLTVARN